MSDPTLTASLAVTSRGLAVPDPALVELVAGAAHRALSGTDRILIHEIAGEVAEAVLFALSAEGRLLPPVAETCTEYGLARDGHVARYGSREKAEYWLPLSQPGWKLVSREVGPWLPVPDTEERTEKKGGRLLQGVGRCPKCYALLYRCERSGCGWTAACGEAYCAEHLDDYVTAGLPIPLCELPTWDGPCALHTGHPQPCIPVAEREGADA